jgi:RNA polymerase sigma factor (TIGR02999 family)
MVNNPALRIGPTAPFRAVSVLVWQPMLHSDCRDSYSIVDLGQCPARCEGIYENVESFISKQATGMTDHKPITSLLRQWRSGDEAALDKLSPLVYQELHRIAAYFMGSERESHTLQPTALVNEAFLKLLGSDVNWSDRRHFYAVAARQMRRILIDHSRSRKRMKRGSSYLKVAFDENCLAHDLNTGILDIDDVLEKLEKLDSRKHDMIELYYFGGLKIGDIARCYEISTKTVQRELRMAEAWLHTTLNPDEDNP